MSKSSTLFMHTKHFVKVAEDKNSTTLRHKAGHEIKISHNALSEDVRKQMKALPLYDDKTVKKFADGGDISTSNMKTHAGSVDRAEMRTSGQSQEDQDQASKVRANPVPYSGDQINKANDAWGKANSYAKGGSVNPNQMAARDLQTHHNRSVDKRTQMYADGGEINESNSQDKAPITINVGGATSPNTSPQVEKINPDQVRPQVEPISQEEANQQQPVPQGAAQVQGQPVQAPPSPEALMDAQASQQAQAGESPTQGDNPQQAAQGQQDIANATNPQQYSKKEQIAGVPQQDLANSINSQIDTSASPDNDYQNTFNQGAKGTMEGMHNEAIAQAQLGKQQALMRDDYIKGQQGAVAQFQKHYRDIDKDIQDTMQDIKNQHIDPNHYLNSKNSFSKIKIGIGMILGGMSAGTLGGPNPAVTMLNQQIDRDIDAQKANLGKSQSLLSANFHRFGNLRDATEMTRMMQTQIVSNQIQSAAEKSQSPIALARAQQAINQLKMNGIAPYQQNMAMRKMMMGNGENASNTEAAYTGKLHALQIMAPQMYKDYQSKYIPGEGVAEAVPTEGDKKSVEKLNAFSQLVNHAIDLQKKVGMTGAWSPTNRATAESLQSALTTQMNDLSGLNRLTHDEMVTYTKSVGQLGSVNSGVVLHKLESIQQQISDHKSTLLKSLNVQPFAKANQNAVALQWAQSNPNDPRAAQIMQRLGGK
jgi:hypothetical protein